jgi:hypothetical protein
MSDSPGEAGDDHPMVDPHPHSAAAGAPGASGPGGSGYEGEATVGDEGAAAGPEAFSDPFGRPDSTPDA